MSPSPILFWACLQHCDHKHRWSECCAVCENLEKDDQQYGDGYHSGGGKAANPGNASHRSQWLTVHTPSNITHVHWPSQRSTCFLWYFHCHLLCERHRFQFDGLYEAYEPSLHLSSVHTHETTQNLIKDHLLE